MKSLKVISLIIFLCVFVLSFMSCVNIKNLFDKPSKANKENFISLKTKGIEAIKQNKLSAGIQTLEDALLIQDDKEIKRILDEAYFERGDYYYTINDIQKAKSDLSKSKNKKALNLLIYIKSKEKIKMLYPGNGSKPESLKIKLEWETDALADYYSLQIQDKSWKIVVSKFVKKSKWLNNNKLVENMVYYWAVRPHYPNNTWGVWSDKWWFAIETPETKTKKAALEAEKQAFKERDKLRSIIRVSNVYPSSPNSVGGVDLYIVWQNTSSKTIKYITFTVDPYNTIGNKATCNIRRYSRFNGTITGPINSGVWRGNDGYSWEHAWFNNTIVKVKLVEINIEYMDGTTMKIGENDIKSIQF